MTSDLLEVCSNLKRRGFLVHLFDTPEQTADFLLDQITSKESVGIGGSITIDQIGIYDKLISRGNPVFWHWKSGNEVRKKALLSDVYLCSTNALTISGELVNIDGNGNRTGAMVFGPNRCFVVCGTNKICPDLQSAVDRIKNIACPQNARRLGLDVPCAKLGRCVECSAKIRMCRVTTIFSYPANGRETHVCLIKGSFGY